MPAQWRRRYSGSVKLKGGPRKRGREEVAVMCDGGGDVMDAEEVQIVTVKTEAELVALF